MSFSAWQMTGHADNMITDNPELPKGKRESILFFSLQFQSIIAFNKLVFH